MTVQDYMPIFIEAFQAYVYSIIIAKKKSSGNIETLLNKNRNSEITAVIHKPYHKIICSDKKNGANFVV